MVLAKSLPIATQDFPKAAYNINRKRCVVLIFEHALISSLSWTPIFGEPLSCLKMQIMTKTGE